MSDVEPAALLFLHPRRKNAAGSVRGHQNMGMCTLLSVCTEERARCSVGARLQSGSPEAVETTPDSVGEIFAAGSQSRPISVAGSDVKGIVMQYRASAGGREEIEVWATTDKVLEKKMDSRRLQGFRLACIFAVSFVAFAQGEPRRRVVVVDGSGAPVNTAWRSTPEASAPILRVREIDRNEAAIIDICFRYVDAQLTYFRSARRADGYLAFAERIRSGPGMRDGLYWPLNAVGEESPMGPRFAAAAAAELDPTDAQPLFGYYFKILAAQGPEAVGGARDYRVDGRLIAGFALVAWPAGYGVTGVRAFLVSHRGDVYAKDLGAGTARSAPEMTVFAPDPTWTRVASMMD